MRELFKLRNISFNINDIDIFEDVNASVQERDIIGVIGKNGAGKSTLLQLINKELVPSKGKIEWIEEDVKIVLVEQETEAFSSVETSALESTLLKKWDVPSYDFSKFSGGERLKARLANGFAKEAQLLLLDEPTNHLDEESKDLLIEQLKQLTGTVILVSHDRYLLDIVATKIWSMEGSKLIEHKGNYSSYMEDRKQKRRSQQREYDKQQKMIGQIEGQMKELTSWSNKAHSQSTKKEGYKEYYRVKAKRTDAQVKSKQKRLEKELEKTKAKPVEPEYTVNFSMQANKKVGRRFLEVKNLTKAFDKRTLFKDANFTIQHGEKIAIIGPNGSGKTTLVNIIVGEETAEGEVWMSPSANIGYLTQEVFDLPLEKSPEQLFFKETFEARGKVQNLMKHLGFDVLQWSQPIRNMSMGERIKCKLMVYILEEKDVLLLDEPTNHLDLPSREQLENTLAVYNGTLLVVSHDRYFLDKTTSSKLVISNEGIQKHLQEVSPTRNNNQDELRLRLETERQEVLGKLSFLTPNDKGYAALDKKFKELTNQINELV
ncbi:ribosomal protection-like ABC-F family protein [Aquibacillus rhizosphaerae]|uniref:Ribosome protection protein VmlR n=1 Tax=Aquibacillus rhizosphaerae TaxID=3051431 RepID=A0ABT7LAA3_9BACI|nr:ABC-F type ribosomal protection protein [Aquibacillus sp. LR5S19]MDL4842329.1 ABC-F type ribosomal protection protein [Aquibacillus sp. LR5S19]